MKPASVHWFFSRYDFRLTESYIDVKVKLFGFRLPICVRVDLEELKKTFAPVTTKSIFDK